MPVRRRHRMHDHGGWDTVAAGIRMRSGAFGRSGCSGQSVLGGSCRRWSWCCAGESTAATGCRRRCGPSAAQSASIPNTHPVRAASSHPPSRVASACRGVLACMRPSPCSAAHTGPCSRTLLAPAVPTRPSAPGPTPPSVRMLWRTSPLWPCVARPLPRQTRFGMRCVCAVCLSRVSAAYCPCARPDRSKHCAAQLSTARSPGPFKLTVSAAARANLRVSHTERSYRPERRIM